MLFQIIQGKPFECQSWKVSSEHSNSIEIKICRKAFSNSKWVKPLGIKADEKLTVKKDQPEIKYVHNNQKFHKSWAKKISFHAFISQFFYVPVVWIFHNQKLNSHKNETHEGALKFVHQDRNSTVDEFLARDSSLKIHERILQNCLWK